MKSFVLILALAATSQAFAVSYSTPTGMILWKLNECRNDKTCKTPASVIIEDSLQKYLDDLPSQREKADKFLEIHIAKSNLVKSYLSAEDQGTNVEVVYERIAKKIEDDYLEKKKLIEETLIEDHSEFDEIRAQKEKFAEVEKEVASTNLYEPKKAALEKQEKMLNDYFTKLVQSPRASFEKVGDYLREEPKDFWFINFEIQKEYKSVDENCFPVSFSIQPGKRPGIFSLKDDKNVVSKFINGPKSKRLAIKCPHYPIVTPSGMVKASYSVKSNELKDPWRYRDLDLFNESHIGSSQEEIVALIRKKIK